MVWRCPAWGALFLVGRALGEGRGHPGLSLEFTTGPWAVGSLTPPAVEVPRWGQLGELPQGPREAPPPAVLTRRGSPALKASGRSWAPGSQTLMGPVAEASWYWVRSRCSCAGLRAGNAACRLAQLI